MTQEDKQLLLIDLCTRLPYGAKVWYLNGTGVISTVKGIVDDICYFNENPKYGNSCRIETVKPYLRPMSSMTEEEKQSYYKLLDNLHFADGSFYSPDIKDWLDKHHFDYRGLIEKSLALEASEGMYES